MRFLLLLLLALYTLFALFLADQIKRYQIYFSARPAFEEGKLLLRDLRLQAKIKEQELTTSLREVVLFPPLQIKEGTLAFLSPSKKKETSKKKPSSKS